MSLLESLEVAREGFDWRLRAVRDWSHPTPCSAWVVRDVVNHVVGQEYRFARLLAGGSLEEYAKTREDDWLGHDAVGAWTDGREELDEAISEFGSLDRNIPFRGGPRPGEVVLRIRLFDLTIHTWDLAKGIGVDDTLDQSLVNSVLDRIDVVNAVLLGIDDTRLQREFFAPPEELRDGMTAQERLLAMFGRSNES